jgi:hypothetical protein
MHHTVCIEDHIDPTQWLEVAKFRWHADACVYARALSNEGWERAIRVESDRDYVNVYYRRGEEIPDEKSSDWVLNLD